MRYESAMKVVRCLRGSLDDPLSILAICSRIDLSYQPTYRHVRELEAAGVISTERVGREVLCRLADGEPAALWLALASMEDTERALAENSNRLANELVSAARAGRLGELLGLAIVSEETGRKVLAVLPGSADAAPARIRAQALCDAHGVSDAEVLALSREQFMRRLLQEWTPVSFAERAQILAGHQAMWQAVLAAAPVKPPQAKPGRKTVKPRPPRRPRQPSESPAEDVAFEEQFEEQFID